MIDELIVDRETRLTRARRSEELARWLREAGHRRRPTGPQAGEPRVHSALTPTHSRLLDTALRPNPARLARLSLLGLLALSYLQYFYADTMLHIYSMHSLIVFILVNGHA